MTRDFVIKNVKTINVLVDRSGVDIVSICVDDFTAFPALQYDTYFEVRCQHGKGVDFVKSYLGVEPDNIVSTDLGVVKNK